MNELMPIFCKHLQALYWKNLWSFDNIIFDSLCKWDYIQGFKKLFVFPYSIGRPLKGRNILGCSWAISLHLHFRVLYGTNRFQINESGFQTEFQSKAL